MVILDVAILHCVGCNLFHWRLDQAFNLNLLLDSGNG